MEAKEGRMSEKTEITPEEFQAALEVVRRKRAGGKTIISLSTPAEVLKATELGVINKSEARIIFGFKKRRAPVRRAKV
jgi:hypothetical protein